MESNNENAVVEKLQVSICHKMNLSIDEAVSYSGMGKTKLYEIINNVEVQNGE